MTEIGRYIAVYGPACSGKTTVSKHLSEILGIPHIELDSVFWQPEWQKPLLDEFRAEVSGLIEKHPHGWVFDGNYSNARDLILARADTVIWLDLPFHITIRRLLKRCVRRCRTHELLWGINREDWKNVFLSRDSLIIYLITHWRKYKKGIGKTVAGLPENVSVYQLRSSGDVAELFAALPGEKGLTTQY